MNSLSCRVWPMALLVLASVASFATADPQQTLEDKGLKKLTTHWVLPDETDFNKSLSEMRKYKKVLTDAIRTKMKVEKGLAAVDREIDNLNEQRVRLRQLSVDPALASNSTQYNRVIQQINAVHLRLGELYELKQQNKELQAANKELAQARQEFVEELSGLRRRAEAISNQYKTLSEEKDVTDALTEIKAAGDKPYELGPSRSFDSNLRTLEGYEKSVESESIPLREESKTFYVYVTINGAPGKEFVFDTGASAIAMSTNVANELGITVADDATVVHCTIADGSTVTGKLVFLESVKVGNFEVPNVEAIVMDPQYANAPSLLGGSFINNFFYRIDPTTASLTLSRLSDEADSKKSSSRSRKR